MERTEVDSGTTWEAQAGYSRAVRVGNEVHVSGTTATAEDGSIVGVGDPRAQARQALDNVEWALREAGADPEHVVRTRLYVTDTDDWPAVASPHDEAFGDVNPAATLVEVQALVEPELLVEVEATAIVPE